MTQPATPAAPATPLADHPRVPQPKGWSRLAIGLGIFGAVVTAGYAWSAATDYEPYSPARDEVPASVRSSPGGYRSFHFWHSGYHGGK